MTISDQSTQIEGGTNRRKKRRRCRRYLLLIAMAILVGAILLLPTLLSTNAGRRIILRVLNERIDGRVSIEEISLSWAGPCEAKNILVTDESHREVFRADSVFYARGLWRVLTDWQQFEQIRTDAPYTTIYLDSKEASRTGG
ncbi:MAG: hypothetical protein ACYSTL_03865, partial [Planctomycetota bacterium]